jgi:hypothetical protein
MTVTPFVSDPLPEPSVTVTVTVRAAVDGLSEVLLYVTSRSAAWYAAGLASPVSVSVFPLTDGEMSGCEPASARTSSAPA